MKHIDAAGKDITPGAYFVYSTRIADRAHLQFGRVLELKTGERGYPTSTIPKIGAITVNNAFAWRGDGWRACGNGRVQTLERLDALLVVPRTSLSPDILAAIERAYKAARDVLRERAAKPAKCNAKPEPDLTPADITYGG